MAIEGERTVEINAPIERCFEIAADIEHAPEWQGSLKDVEVLSRHDDGTANLVETVSDAKVKAVRTRLIFAYTPPGEITWTQQRGDLNALIGGWRFEDLGEDRTRATYWLKADPGRMLGLLLRGPAEGKVKDFLLGNAADGLKERAEEG